jgi:hypothetical protein
LAGKACIETKVREARMLSLEKGRKERESKEIGDQEFEGV